MSDEPNRDHRCRTCEHWGAPYVNKPKGRHMCTCPLPFFAYGPQVPLLDARNGKDCAAYMYSYRRARLVKP